MQGIGIVAIDWPPLEEFCDVSQGGSRKDFFDVSQGGLRKNFVLAPYEQLRVSEYISNGTSSKNMLGFFHF